MAIAKNVITVTSEAYDEDTTTRDLVRGLANQLDLIEGTAKGLKLDVVKKTNYYRSYVKLVAHVTVTQERAEVARP